MSQPEGLYGKYFVSRIDGRDNADGDRKDAEYFVLDIIYDPHAREALDRYIRSCRDEHPKLAKDLRALLEETEIRHRRAKEERRMRGLK